MALDRGVSSGWLPAVLGAARTLIPGWTRWGSARPSRVARERRVHHHEPLEDALTGCKTRFGLAAPLAAAFDRAEAARRELSLLCIGLDEFAALTDAFGLEAGERVLAELARRLRATAQDQAPVARIAGDEFLLVLEGDRTRARRIAAQLLDQLSRPYATAEQPITITCSIGIAVYPQHGSPHAMIGFATTAMRMAKRQGGGGFAEYDPRMGEDLREQQELARDLRVAVEKRQLELFYQPKIDASTLTVTAAEALLRWHHPTRGIVSPAVFIPIAERHRLICPIGHWVIDEATRQAAAWRDVGLRMRVAVNVSGYQMRQDDFVARLADALKRHRLQPGRFTCEITETVAMEDTRATRDAFERLGKLGVHVSIDDFGTGFSSLASLRHLPAQELKIDRAFVADVDTSPEAREIVRAVVQMARTMQLRVVAEGVETRAQCDSMVRLGCDELQGYLFARPMSARALGIWAAGDCDADTIAFRSSLFKPTDVSSGPA